jgi:hypothetical protein
MTPQSSFMVLAAVNPAHDAELRRLLASMNDAPGRINPDNALIPFQRFDALHVARLLIVDDRTVDDIRVYGSRRVPIRSISRFSATSMGMRTLSRRRCEAGTGRLAGAVLVLRRIHLRHRSCRMDEGTQRADRRRLRQLARANRATGSRGGGIV